MTQQSNDLSMQVANTILKNIISNHYPPGSFLPSERELQEEHPVSRPLVREAIKLLSAKGVVTTNSRQGTVVNPDLVASAVDAVLLTLYRSGAYIEDILNTRILLEPPIVALAAKNATPLQIREIVAVGQTSKTIMLDDGLDAQEKAVLWKDNDIRFHTVIAEACPNPVLPILIQIIMGGLWKQFSSLPSLEVLEKANEHHENLGTLIAGRNGAAAQRLMLEHLEYSRTNLSEIQENLVVW